MTKRLGAILTLLSQTWFTL